MSTLEYIGPELEISNSGIVYRTHKEDKFVYIIAALEILKSIENDPEKKSLYSHVFESDKVEKDNLLRILQDYENDVAGNIARESKKYHQKIQHKIKYIKTLPHLTETDKNVWIKNIELMKAYKITRAINKMYYMHCIQNIVQIIKHKKIKEITVPFNKNFFHVINTLKGALITGNPSLDATVIEEYNKNDTIVLRLKIRN